MTPSDAPFPYATPRAFETALTARFKAASVGSPFNHSQLRRQFAYDRLLARCFAADDAHRWILKGGISMLARLGQARHSADVDLVVQAADVTTALAELRRTAARDLGDLFTFTLAPPRSLVQGIEGVRVPAQALLGRRVFESFHIDLVTGVRVTGPAETAAPIVPLDIPGLVRPDYRIYPLADSVADKVCAIVERHQERPSTRFRDLCDLVLVARTQTLYASKLRQALDSEHHRRALDRTAAFEVPDPTLWSAGYAKAVKDVSGLEAFRTLPEALALVKALIDPVLSGQAEGCWNPEAAAWDHQGGAQVVHGP
ncbi:nucleotidyl transferase AbiEii/AbiGii toxin family protein [Streptomyces sp. NPDC048442]|uniref:nucleotidyl transferase AbiEii/AbiGii toxin family protein n=1 Tax=Streptomyces sp. NPDC048442 TaxID=3154823 RepID=UPI00342D8326